MKVLAIIGSYRKGRTIDTLVGKAIDGAKARDADVTVDEIRLIDRRIEYCRNCMACRNSDAKGP